MPTDATRPDTIYALSSGAGMAGVAVVRVSGSNTDNLLKKIGIVELPRARYAALHNLSTLDGADIIDQALVLRFPAPASFTGEDVAELHIHGSEAVLDRLFREIGASGLARLAEPGEFTRRAFENGKLDLTGAEALGDLIAARTDRQRRQALRQYDGGLAALYDGWRTRLIGIMAHAEAEIDFSDEELPEALHTKVVANINEIIQEINQHRHTGLLGENIRLGLPVVIVGAPNVGKSSLLNTIARRDAAIVSEEAGTTRDVVEVQMNLGGFAVTLQDTAGIHEARGAVEKEGIRRAEQSAVEAALMVAVLDATSDTIPDRIGRLIDERTILVANKTDLVNGSLTEVGGIPLDHAVSVRTGDGIDAFLVALEDHVSRMLSGHEGLVPTRARHREALAEAADALDRAVTAKLPELAAEDIRLAVRALGRITGRVDIDEMLDAVFRDFCIGK